MSVQRLSGGVRASFVQVVVGVLAAVSLGSSCQNSFSSINSLSFQSDVAPADLTGHVIVDKTDLTIAPGGANQFAVQVAPASQMAIQLLYTEPKNMDAGATARIADIETSIKVPQDLSAPMQAAGGKVTITGNKAEMPALILNCDALFNVSIGPSDKEGQGRLTISFKGLKGLASCTPEPKVNLALYNPLLIAHRDPSEGLAVYSMEEDAQRGKDFVTEFMLEEGIFVHDRSDALSTYVQQIAEKVVAASDLPDQKVTAYVIDQDDINAFAVPGGFVFVNRGLLQNVESEAELVGVLGHEWSHVTCRHSSREKTSYRLLAEKTAADQREYEYEADAIGTQYAWNAGYEPTAMNTLFQKIIDADPKSDADPAVEAASDHPATYKRMERIETYAQLFYPAKDRYLRSSPEFTAMKAAVAPVAAIAPMGFRGGALALTLDSASPADTAAYKERVEEIFQRHFGQR